MFRSCSRRNSLVHPAVLAVSALLLGVAFYWISRPQGTLAVLAQVPAAPFELPPLIESWLGWLPTATHVFAFSLLTWLALGGRHPAFACGLWGVINALFELGQALPVSVTAEFPDVLHIRSYFHNGVFDLLDLAACGFGAWLAWYLLRSQAQRNLRLVGQAVI